MKERPSEQRLRAFLKHSDPRELTKRIEKLEFFGEIPPHKAHDFRVYADEWKIVLADLDGPIKL